MIAPHNFPGINRSKCGCHVKVWELPEQGTLKQKLNSQALRDEARESKPWLLCGTLGEEVKKKSQENMVKQAEKTREAWEKTPK